MREAQPSSLVVRRWGRSDVVLLFWASTYPVALVYSWTSDFSHPWLQARCRGLLDDVFTACRLGW